MSKMEDVKDFLSHKKIAVIGVSRSGKKFGNAIYKELKSKGYQLFPVNPNADRIHGDPCYPDLKSLPEKVDGVVINVKPNRAEAAVRDAVAAGIPRVWLHRGAQSKEALDLCEKNGITTISRECILMFAEPTAWIHRLHRGLCKFFGKLPK